MSDRPFPSVIAPLPLIWRRWLATAGVISASVIAGVTTSVLGWGGTAAIARAAETATPPAELTDLVTRLDAAAESEDLDAAIALYAPNFRSDDGLERDTLQTALTQFWAAYDQLDYTTEVTTWERSGDDLIAETRTTIRGTQASGDRPLSLDATLTARQTIRNGQIVAQTILSEASELSSGEGAPTVDVRLPERVRSGQEFTFDAIVQEPIGTGILLGAAIAEQVAPAAYLDPSDLPLEPLASGGLFKVGRAPADGGDRWISAILVSSEGMTVVTRRLQVER